MLGYEREMYIRRSVAECRTIDPVEKKKMAKKTSKKEEEVKEVTEQLSKVQLLEKECVICLEAVEEITPTVLGCCKQPAHAACVNEWKQERSTFGCPHCRQAIPLNAVEVPYPDFWKEDERFVEQIKKEWKDNVFWYGAGYNADNEWRVGFWGMFTHPYAFESEKNAVCFLGYHKGQVIPRMKTMKSFM